MSMISSLRRFMAARRGAAFARDEKGVAAVEFALLSSVLLAMMGGGLDLTHALTIQRDVARVSVEIAQSMSTCRDEDCLGPMMQAISARQSNIMIGFPTASVGMALIARRNGVIEVRRGSMTFLPADVNTKAMQVLADDDFGVVNLITHTHTPMLIGFASGWGFNVANFRSFTVALMTKGGARQVVI